MTHFWKTRALKEVFIQKCPTESLRQPVWSTIQISSFCWGKLGSNKWTRHFKTKLLLALLTLHTSSFLTTPGHTHQQQRDEAGCKGAAWHNRSLLPNRELHIVIKEMSTILLLLYKESAFLFIFPHIFPSSSCSSQTGLFNDQTNKDYVRSGYISPLFLPAVVTWFPWRK